MRLGLDRPEAPRDWNAVPSVIRAREQLGRGKCRAAVAEAWNAATLAVNADDERGLEIVRDLAREIETRSSGRAHRQAMILGSYVDHCRVAAAVGGRQGSLLARLFGTRTSQPTKTCPDCAEQVKAQANVCRFCGHRFTGA